MPTISFRRFRCGEEFFHPLIDCPESLEGPRGKELGKIKNNRIFDFTLIYKLCVKVVTILNEFLHEFAKNSVFLAELLNWSFRFIIPGVFFDVVTRSGKLQNYNKDSILKIKRNPYYNIINFPESPSFNIFSKEIEIKFISFRG